ncbi:hypothetical protein [Marinobacterium iners]|uniref:Uncharacterized protein n=1 Tax=Marinobacterium iners DSM 11526 TaxID=1122198 RepID=A0A1H3ZUY3_9GAMM|nr:hypothetical protein [Marinobacterium iners]SEA27470.1 hypothetical protein SAMN02745729_102176 [Marinobacterium iners DSM 11526]
MTDIYQLEASKLKVLKLQLKHGLQFNYTCYDDGDGVWKIEDGVCKAREVRMCRHPNSPYQPEWREVAKEEHLVSHVVVDWPAL